MSIETPRSSSNQDSTRILTDFRSRIEKRWIEFDIATLNEAAGMAMVRDMHPQYQSTKEAFDQAKGILGTLKTDAELKKALSGPTSLSAHIANIEKYIATLKAPERNKEYNMVLSNTLADIHALKQGLNGSPRTPDPVPVLAKKPEGIKESIPTLSGIQNLTNQALKPIEDVAGDIKKVALGAGVTVAATGLISEGGFKKVLAEGFTKMKDWVMSIFEGDGIFAKFFGDKKNMIAGMFDKLGIGLPLSSAEAGTLPEDQKNNIEKNASYIASVSLIRKFFLPKDSFSAGEIYSYTSFGNKKFSEISDAYKNKKGHLKEFFGVSQVSNISEKDLEIALGSLVDGGNIRSRTLLSQIRRSCGDGYQSMTMLEIFQKIASPLAYLKGLEKIDITSDPRALFDEFGFDIDNEGKAMGDLSIKAENLTLPARKILFISTISGDRFTTPERAMDLLMKTDNSEKIEKDTQLKSEFEKVFAFGKKFQEKVLSTPALNLGYSDQFREVFEKKGLSFRGLSILYCMLDGKTDFEHMSAVEKLSFYGACANLIADLDSADKGGFTAAYIKKLSSETAEIPSDVREFAKDSLTGIVAKVGDAFWESTKFIFGAVKESPELGVGALALWYFGGAARKRIHKFTHH